MARGNICTGPDSFPFFSRASCLFRTEISAWSAGEIRAGIILWQQPVASDAEARRIVTEASRLRGMAFRLDSAMRDGCVTASLRWRSDYRSSGAKLGRSVPRLPQAAWSFTYIPSHSARLYAGPCHVRDRQRPIISSHFSCLLDVGTPKTPPARLILQRLADDTPLRIRLQMASRFPSSQNMVASQPGCAMMSPAIPSKPFSLSNAALPNLASKDYGVSSTQTAARNRVSTDGGGAHVLDLATGERWTDLYSTAGFPPCWRSK